jgi:hypothetical protein
MKKSELRKIIKEEISKVINEGFESLEDIGDGTYRQPETGFIFGRLGVAEVQKKDYYDEEDYELDLEKGINLLRKAEYNPQIRTYSWGALIKID